MSARVLNANIHEQGKWNQFENSVVKYTVNWSAEYQEDPILTSAWESEDGATITGNAIASTADKTSAYISGNPGQYSVINKITTTSGTTDERTIIVRIKSNTRVSTGIW